MSACPRAPFLLSQRGAALLFAMFLILILSVLGIAMIRQAGDDRIDAARFGNSLTRGVACAEAGLQYGKRLLGAIYTLHTANNNSGWTDILSRQKLVGTPLGDLDWTQFGRYDPARFPGDQLPADLSTVPLILRGDGNNDGIVDPDCDVDGDGAPDFLISIRDNEDETPRGRPVENYALDNDQVVWIRSECTNAAFAEIRPSGSYPIVVEARLMYAPPPNRCANGNCN